MMDFQRQMVNSHFLAPECNWEDSRSPLCIVEDPIPEEIEKPMDLTTTSRICRSERPSPALTPKKRGSLSWMKENNFGKSASEASIPTALLHDKRSRLENIAETLHRNSLPERCDSVPSLRERFPTPHSPENDYEQYKRCMSDSRIPDQFRPRLDDPGNAYNDDLELRRTTSESVLQTRLSDIELLRRQLLRYQFLQGLAREGSSQFPATWVPYAGLINYSQLLQSVQAQDYLQRSEEHAPSFVRSSPESLAGDDRSGSPTDSQKRRRTPRALTGKHVRLGTGASPSTLITLRKKIEERQRLRPLQGKIGNFGSFGKSKRK